MRHTAIHGEILRHTAIYGDIPLYTATYRDIRRHTAIYGDTPRHTATEHDALQHCDKRDFIYVTNRDGMRQITTDRDRPRSITKTLSESSIYERKQYEMLFVFRCINRLCTPIVNSNAGILVIKTKCPMVDLVCITEVPHRQAGVLDGNTCPKEACI
jgi:hypothetical protein